MNSGLDSLIKTLKPPQLRACMKIVDCIISDSSPGSIIRNFIAELPSIVPAEGHAALDAHVDLRNGNTDISMGRICEESICQFRSFRSIDPFWRLMINTLQPVTNRSLLCDDEWEMHPNYLNVMKPYKIFHFIQSPVLLNGTVKLTINVSRDYNHPFSSSEFRLLTKLVHYLSYGLESVIHQRQIFPDIGSPSVAKTIVGGEQRFDHGGQLPEKESEENMVKIAALELLTEREKQVLVLVLNGLRDREIALKLRISIYTVKEHLKRIYNKLGVSSRVQAVTKAIEICKYLD